MFFLCCGARERRPRVNNDPAEEQGETTWLIGPGRPTLYTADVPVSNPAARIEADALRDIVRETENKMVNITDRQPFLFRDPFSPVDEHFGPKYTPSSPKIPSPADTGTTPYGPSAAPPTRAHTPIQFPHGARHRSYGHNDHGGRSGSPSSTRSLSDDEEDYSHPALPRGPILKVKLIPIPKRARRKKPKEPGDGNGSVGLRGGGCGGDGAAGFSGTPIVHALSKEDHDSIMSLSNNLWAALERDFRITEPPDVVWTWD